MCVCALPSVSVQAECESVRVTKRLCTHVCPLAVCVCACHSEGVWVRMSVCHGERVLVKKKRGEREFKLDQGEKAAALKGRRTHLIIKNI